MRFKFSFMTLYECKCKCYNKTFANLHVTFFVPFNFSISLTHNTTEVGDLSDVPC